MPPSFHLQLIIVIRLSRELGQPRTCFRSHRLWCTGAFHRSPISWRSLATPALMRRPIASATPRSFMCCPYIDACRHFFLPPGEGSASSLSAAGHRRLLISPYQARAQNSRAGLLLGPKGVAMTVNPVRHPDSVDGAGLHHKFLLAHMRRIFAARGSLISIHSYS